MTNILTPTSDIDLAVLDVPESGTTTVDLLNVLADKIVKEGISSYCEGMINFKRYAQIMLFKYDNLTPQLSLMPKCRL